MVTVFQCIFPDGKQFIGKTKLPLQKFIHQSKLRAKNNPKTIFLWALNKAGENVKWIEIGVYWSTAAANSVCDQLINVNQTYDRNFGYNYLTKNGSKWGQKDRAMEKSSLSRVKTRFKKLMESVEDKKLRSRIETLMRDIDNYLKEIKGLKQQL